MCIDINSIEENINCNDMIRTASLASWVGKSAQQYQKELFPTLNDEQIKEREDKKKMIFSEEEYKKNIKKHRPDLAD